MSQDDRTKREDALAFWEKSGDFEHPPFMGIAAMNERTSLPYARINLYRQFLRRMSTTVGKSSLRFLQRRKT